METTHRKSITSVFGFCNTVLAIIGLFILFPGVIMAQWNTNTSINLLISGLPTADIQSAPTSDGKTWIAFYHQNGGNYDMRAQLIDANGYKLLGPDGMLVGNHTSGSATFVFNVCVDASNNFIIGYQDERSGSMQAVVYKISEAGTLLWGDGIVLGGGLAPYPAALSNGEVAVSWNADAGNTLNLQKITVTGTTAWTTPVAITVGSAKTTRGQIIANTEGKFTVVYQKSGVGISTTLFAQMYNNSGTALFSPLQICSETTSGARYYSLVAEADTTYFGYYSSVGMRFNSYLQRINPDGTIPWGMNGSHFNTATGSGDSYQGETSIGLNPGSDHVWSVCTFSNTNQTQYGVYAQKFLKSTGARQFTDLGKVVYPIGSNRDQLAGSLAVVFDTPMFMTYVSSYRIYATRLDGNGDFMWPGNRVEISSTTASAGNGKMRYGFTPVGPNRCAGTWTENREGSGYMGYAQGVSIGGLTGLKVETLGGVPAVIAANGGTLQMVATVFPAAANQAVTWSIVAGTGMASITTTGMVTAVSNGTVYAKASAVQDPTVFDSLMISISGQSQPPAVITLPATAITSSGATLNGSVNANGLTTDVSFEWGLTSAYGNTITSSPASVTGTTITLVLANLSGLTSNTTYHYRIKGTNAAGPATGDDLTFITPVGVGAGEKLPMRVEIYPVPNDGRFNIFFSGRTGNTITLEVFNNLGSKIMFKSGIQVQGTDITAIDLRPIPQGIYTLIIHHGGEKVISKILVTK